MQSGTGLRDRQKAQRRRDILEAASDLFAENGIDGTTLSDIADRIGVSPPTIANYFGTKDNILTALLFEGIERERAQHQKSPRRTGCDFAVLIAEMLCEMSERTMNIAGKRVWRYAEARNIRQPNSDFERRFAYSDSELIRLISVFLAGYDIVLRNRAEPDCDFLGTLFFDRWTQLYFAYIKDDQMTMDTHQQAIKADCRALVSYMFDDGFAATSPLKREVVV